MSSRQSVRSPHLEPTSRHAGRLPECAPSLDEVLAQIPALGVRRLILIALQLATELDLAQQSGVAHEPVSAFSVRLERAGTPFEQALLTPASEPAGVCPAERSLSEFGAVLVQLLQRKPLYLEGSVWAPASKSHVAMSRRADADVLASLRRAVALIADKCQGGRPGSHYDNAFDVAQDLAKLASITGRIVVRRRPLAPLRALTQPRRRAELGREPLPKVIIQQPAARLSASDVRAFRGWAAALGPAHSLRPWALRLQSSLARL
jgi:hypothetical protein